MTRDYKPAPQRSNDSKGNPFISGLLVGVLLGIGAALAVTLMIRSNGSPFTNKNTQASVVEPLTPEAKSSDEDSQPKNENPKSKTDDQKHFDFYTILPGTESSVTEKEIKDSPAKTVKKDNYFLQTGAFQNESDADNMKAKLALQGFEAVVQTAEIPEKGVWHRVRVGPLAGVDQINKMRSELVSQGFNADLIKVHSETTPQ